MIERAAWNWTDSKSFICVINRKYHNIVQVDCSREHLFSTCVPWEGEGYPIEYESVCKEGGVIRTCTYAQKKNLYICFRKMCKRCELSYFSLGI